MCSKLPTEPAPASASLPRPGRPVRGSRSGQPIMTLFDLLGRRWAMGIVWALAGEPRTFRALQAYCDSASPSVLNARLKKLRGAGVVERAEAGYTLTPDGQALFAVLEPLGGWAKDWAERLAKADEADTRA